MTVRHTAPVSTLAHDDHGRGLVSLNGTLVGGEAAFVSVFDHGLLYGDGVFDTMFATYGYIFKLREQHMAVPPLTAGDAPDAADPRGGPRGRDHRDGRR